MSKPIFPKYKIDLYNLSSGENFCSIRTYIRIKKDEKYWLVPMVDITESRPGHELDIHKIYANFIYNCYTTAIAHSYYNLTIPDENQEDDEPSRLLKLVPRPK